MSEAPQAAPGDVVDIGTVAASNIGRAINAHPDTYPVIKRAIVDEINAMSSHFTLAFADIQTQYEAAVYQAKAEYQRALSTFNFVQSNKLVVTLSIGVFVAVGFFVGWFLR